MLVEMAELKPGTLAQPRSVSSLRPTKGRDAGGGHVGVESQRSLLPLFRLGHTNHLK